MAQVVIRNLNKKFDGVHAVNDVNLQIRDKEFLVLVGPSGCGKTTTLRMVAGLESITAGEISIGDKVVNELAPMDRDIAMVFQNYALYPHMSVYDNMAFGLKMRKFAKPDIAKRVQEAAEILGIQGLLLRKPRQLSGGQRQRVALGRAIVRHPQVFLFDEPLSNLDAKLRVQMRVELKKLHLRLGTTAIYVTHDQVEAMTLGDRVVVMKDGWVQQVGEPLELYNNPANRFVAGFLGSPAMNFLNVTVAECRARAPASCAVMSAGSCGWAFARKICGSRPAPRGTRRASTWSSKWWNGSARKPCWTSRPAPARWSRPWRPMSRPRSGIRCGFRPIPSGCTSSTSRPRRPSEPTAVLEEPEMAPAGGPGCRVAAKAPRLPPK
jgi:ABC-type sugar transport system ATPase subunit